MTTDTASVGAPMPNVQRLPLRLHNDDRRVIARLFTLTGEARLHAIIERLNQFSDAEVDATLKNVLGNFESRHEKIHDVFAENFRKIAELVGWKGRLSRKRRLLIGSYFTMEYSIESAALFNPSIVPHPNQEGTPPGAVRVIMSLRATGEGHVSSAVFRTGTIFEDEGIQLDPAAQFSAPVERVQDNVYFKPLFRRKLAEMAASAATIEAVMNRLPDQFTFAQLKGSIGETGRQEHKGPFFDETIDCVLWVARNNYELTLDPDTDISEVVLFPQSDSESRGIEDLRLVLFKEDDGTTCYYGSYTAFNGIRVLPMLVETPDFRTIRVHTLNGACARDKGMALFPRRVNGHYCMCSRLDGRFLYIMYSDMVHFWESAERLAMPEYPWEMMLMGNCGSPIETEAGWILFTHGVGPMRRYCIGAMLLDRGNPLHILGRLPEPLIAPTESEREGYVPNVVYSCGSMLHRGRIYLPYAMADKMTGMATIDAAELIQCLLANPPKET